MKRDFPPAQSSVIIPSLPSFCNFLPEYFGGRFVAEAFAWCGVELSADFRQMLISEGEWIGFAGLPFSGSPVCVLNSAFLQRALRVTEPCLRAQPGLKIRSVGELRTAVERDRAPRFLR